MLALANTSLRASGYRTTNQQGHHTRTIETLEYTIGADAKLIRKLLAFSKKRTVAGYDSAGSISSQELNDILAQPMNFAILLEHGWKNNGLRPVSLLMYSRFISAG
ncbi:hypothetical protein [Granulicella arctica]|uniref:hypothetical protein n=1 Tax=Granulicella arctica TaxID=940613 RepID=UPI0021DFEEAC|nr:hypothetical protein [Granulicella arctica]